MTKLRETEKRQLKEGAIRAEIERLRVTHNARVAYLQSLLSRPAAPAPKKRVVVKKKVVKKVPTDAQLKNAAKVLKKELESPQFAQALKQGVEERDAIEVQPAKVG